MQRIAGGVMAGTQGLLLRLARRDLGLQALEGNGLGRDVGRMAFARTGEVLLLRKPEHVVGLLLPHLELAVLGGDLRLRFELFELGAELLPDVLDPREILARVGDPRLGFLAPLLVLRHARRFLEEDAQLLRLGLDHTRDHPLLDDRVGARTETRAQEQVVDVAAPDRDVVDVVRRIAVARQHALDRELRVLAPLPADAALAVVEVELDRRAPDRLALARAVEDDVLHRLAAQGGGLRLAQHPAHGVDDVGFAAAVGADDADELAGRADGRGIDEGLEPGEFDLGEAHGGSGYVGGASGRQSGVARHGQNVEIIAESSRPAGFAVALRHATRRPSSTAWQAASPPPATGSRTGTSRRQRSLAYAQRG